MNIDLLPFSAFALDASGPTVLSAGDGQTLTLKLALAPLQPFEEPMDGIATANATVGEAGGLRASVVAADGRSITLTF